MINRWVIGDVHGCYHTLLKLLDRIGAYDFIYYTGDLCDRGLFTRDVIELVKNSPKMDSVLGNHDLMFAELHWQWTARNGSIQTMQSYDANIRNTDEHRQWLSERPMFIELDDVVISHSGCIYDNWHRNLPEEHNGKLHICGHTPVKQVYKTKHGIMLDTGCVFGINLTAYNIDDGTWIQEPMDKSDSMWMDRARKLSE